MIWLLVMSLRLHTFFRQLMWVHVRFIIAHARSPPHRRKLLRFGLWRDLVMPKRLSMVEREVHCMTLKILDFEAAFVPPELEC
mmetsp:Transcript_85838/g.135549  ORF Transcript_85838/g.135549 Transcript_85838/m.135549 type:complete len:83 (-) Transcript_85838:11-259(-)